MYVHMYVRVNDDHPNKHWCFFSLHQSIGTSQSMTSSGRTVSSVQDVSVACVGGQNHSKHCRAAWTTVDAQRDGD